MEEGHVRGALTCFGRLGRNELNLRERMSEFFKMQMDYGELFPTLAHRSREARLDCYPCTANLKMAGLIRQFGGS